MGKRNKNIMVVTTTSQIEAETIENLENGEHIVKDNDSKIVSSKRKKKKSKAIDDIIENPKKRKFNLSDSNLYVSEGNEDIEITKTKSKSLDKVKKQEIEKPKKIKFGEDGEPQDTHSSETLENSNSKKDKAYLNAEEQNIKDDEIDEYCNKLDDEDNKQYESWITLLESKLASNEPNEETRIKKKKKKKKKNNESNK